MSKIAFDHIVCSCHNVTLGEIIYAIKEKNAETFEDIAKLTDAGTMCGCCRSSVNDFSEPKKLVYIDQILKKFHTK